MPMSKMQLPVAPIRTLMAIKATNATNKKKAIGTPEGGKKKEKHKAVTIDEPSIDRYDSAAYNTTPTKEKKGGKEKKKKTPKTSASKEPRGKVVTDTKVNKIAEEICEKGPDAVILTKEWGRGSMRQLLKEFRLLHTKSASAKELRSQLKRESEAGLRESRTIPLNMPSDSLVYKPILGAAKPIVRPENTYGARKFKSSEDEDSDKEEDEEEEEDEDNEDYGKLVTPPIPMSKFRMPTFPKPQGVDLLEEFDAAAAPPEPVESIDAELCSEGEAPEKVDAPPAAVEGFHVDAGGFGETIDDHPRSKMPDVHEKVDALPALIAPRAISDIKVISRTGHTLKVSAYQYMWPTVVALRLQPTALLDSAFWVDKLVAEVVEQHRLDVTEDPFQGAYLGRLKQATKTSSAGEPGPYWAEKRSGFSVFVGSRDFTGVSCLPMVPGNGM